MRLGDYAAIICLSDQGDLNEEYCRASIDESGRYKKIGSCIDVTPVYDNGGHPFVFHRTNIIDEEMKYLRGIEEKNYCELLRKAKNYGKVMVD